MLVDIINMDYAFSINEEPLIAILAEPKKYNCIRGTLQVKNEKNLVLPHLLELLNICAAPISN